MEHLRVPKSVKKHIKKTSENLYRKTQFSMPKVPQNGVNIYATYRLKSIQKTAAKHVSKIIKKTCVFEGLKYAKVP